jgi:hypothetical protein
MKKVKKKRGAWFNERDFLIQEAVKLSKEPVKELNKKQENTK